MKLLALVILVAMATLLSVEQTAAKAPLLYKNCTNVNKRYRHGIGRAKARDHVTRGAIPVKSFTHSDRLYKIAMSYNRGLDRDHDGIACEAP
jgi:hypothetical protein